MFARDEPTSPRTSCRIQSDSTRRFWRRRVRTGVSMRNHHSLESTNAEHAASDFDLMQRIAEASATAICAGVAAADADEIAIAVRRADEQAATARRVVQALELAASRDAAAMHALRLAVCEFTYAHRNEGLTPERVLVALKGVVHSRAMAPIRSHMSDRNGNRLRESVSTWCIKAYFDSEGACT